MKNMDTRSLSAEAQEALRTRAVKAVLEGRTRTGVAELLGGTRQSVALIPLRAFASLPDGDAEGHFAASS